MRAEGWPLPNMGLVKPGPGRVQTPDPLEDVESLHLPLPTLRLQALGQHLPPPGEGGGGGSLL